MKKVCVFTSTRAEYGLLYWLIKAISDSEELELQLVVTGTHLSHEYGYTVSDIHADGLEATHTIPVLISNDSPVSIANSSALLLLSLAEYFNREKPDVFIVLGDRVELLAACEAALITKIPIVHLHGGEITEGAMDDRVRHAVSKMANLHFTSTEAYRQRIIQMGELPELVENCGALGLESIFREKLPSFNELSDNLNIDLTNDYFLVVYHPETNKDKEDIADLLKVLDDYPQYQKIIIYPNSDVMSRSIISAIEEYKRKRSDNVELIKSTERKNYLGLMKYCSLLIGNSSSGIIEMPSFYHPIIDIGDRQKGRIRSESTISASMNYESLTRAVEKALSDEFQDNLPNMHNPYQGELPSIQIIKKISSSFEKLEANKKFVDLEFKQ